MLYRYLNQIVAAYASAYTAGGLRWAPLTLGALRDEAYSVGWLGDVEWPRLTGSSSDAPPNGPRTLAYVIAVGRNAYYLSPRADLARASVLQEGSAGPYTASEVRALLGSYADEAWAGRFKAYRRSYVITVYGPGNTLTLTPVRFTGRPSVTTTPTGNLVFNGVAV